MGKKPKNDFRDEVQKLVAQIPEGRVMTYGQIAALCGHPQAARIVGFIARGTQYQHQHAHAERTGLDGVQGDNEKRANGTSGTESESRKKSTPQSAKNTSRVSGSAAKQAGVACSLCELPWHRVVKNDGSLAAGYPGGVTGHASALESEGIQVTNNRIDIERLRWLPTS